MLLQNLHVKGDPWAGLAAGKEYFIIIFRPGKCSSLGDLYSLFHTKAKCMKAITFHAKSV
jgi:hypothetical protein